MNFVDDGFSLAWVVFGWLGLLISAFWAVKTAPWHKMKGDNGAQNVFFAAAVIVFLSWNFPASIQPGLGFHFSFMTIMVLMFGLQFALLLGILVMIGLTLTGQSGIQVMGLNFLLMAWLPAVIVWFFTKWAYRFLDRNFFVFVLFNGFFAAAFSMFVALMAAGGVMYLSEVYTLEALMHSFFPYIPLIVVPEGFVTGMVMGALVLLKPEWVSCFTDEQFLKGK